MFRKSVLRLLNHNTFIFADDFSLRYDMSPELREAYVFHLQLISAGCSGYINHHLYVPSHLLRASHRIRQIELLFFVKRRFIQQVDVPLHNSQWSLQIMGQGCDLLSLRLFTSPLLFQ